MPWYLIDGFMGRCRQRTERTPYTRDRKREKQGDRKRGKEREEEMEKQMEGIREREIEIQNMKQTDGKTGLQRNRTLNKQMERERIVIEKKIDKKGADPQISTLNNIIKKYCWIWC